MKRCIPIAALLLVLIAADALAEEKAAPCCLDAMIQAWSQALLKGDAAAAAALYLDAPELVIVESSGRMRAGEDAARELFTEAFAEIAFSKVDLDPKRTHLGADSGHAYFQLRAEGTLQDGSKVELHVQGTWFLRLVDSSWRIVAEHCSPVKDVERVRVLQQPNTAKD
jgi:uncharacterized protein (TIGR02246 family)